MFNQEILRTKKGGGSKGETLKEKLTNCNGKGAYLDPDLIQSTALKMHDLGLAPTGYMIEIVAFFKG